MAALEGICVREDFIGFFCMVHVLLRTKIVDGNIEVQCSSHRDWRKICGAVASHFYVIHVGESRDLHHGSDTASVNYGHTQVIDQLFADQKIRVPYSIENLAERERRGSVLPDDAETFLKLRGAGVTPTKTNDKARSAFPGAPLQWA